MGSEFPSESSSVSSPLHWLPTVGPLHVKDNEPYRLRTAENRRKKKGCADTCCSVCLADYKGNDSLKAAAWLWPFVPSQVRRPLVVVARDVSSLPDAVVAAATC
ncbi:hypothetical protein F3Y22_tig00111941pilonHSYRG00079 [Hibiscus syriacus]|uniref:Uncharacterized protein n=1 Tax=Hibiscus syriacus TaxID=106335 RepID=A0A6A2XP71_HIBSY|nr:hypothetical protein F3Y22_tig00111941pilonHSYRG00079 [Hibiscus syriacus]